MSWITASYIVLPNLSFISPLIKASVILPFLVFFFAPIANFSSFPLPFFFFLFFFYKCRLAFDVDSRLSLDNKIVSDLVVDRRSWL